MLINLAMLLAGVLLLLGIASSKFSARLGVPVLVLFLSVGMLAGSEGLGRIPFENYSLANSIGSVALALILFDGGLRTSITSVQKVWKPALALSTIGVLITSLITGLAAAWVLKLPLLQGLLVGSIVGSTDAAALGPQGISTAGSSGRGVVVVAAAGAAAGIGRGSGIEVVVAAPQIDTAKVVLVGVEGIRVSAS